MGTDRAARMILVAVIFVGIAFGGGGWDDPATRPLVLQVAIAGAVILVITWLAPGRWLQPAPGRALTPAQRQRAGIVALVSAALALVVLFAADWSPRTEFDMLGLLWLTENIVPAAIFLALAFVAITCAVLAIGGDRKGPPRTETS